MRKIWLAFMFGTVLSLTGGVCVGHGAVVDIFLFIPEIKGESLVQGRTNWNSVQSVSWGHGQPAPGTTGTKVAFDSITFRKSIDSSSPAFALAAASGQIFGQDPRNPVSVDFVRPNPPGPPVVFARLELTNVRVVQYKASGSTDGPLPAESVALSFATIKWISERIGADGRPIPGQRAVAGWDLLTNAPAK